MLLTITEIQHRLAAECKLFTEEIKPLPEHLLHLRLADKWSIAQVTQHLCLSALPVVRLLTGPREVLRQWDAADVTSHTYQQLQTSYQRALASGVKAPAAFTPRPEDEEATKAELVEQFERVYQALSEALDTWSEAALDAYCIPHPALGKLTVRDMLLFVCLHTQHHRQLLPQHQDGFPAA